eukprot:3942711-Pyramimonas_sp.AAC.2
MSRLGTGTIWWRSFSSLDRDIVIFIEMAVNVLQVVPHACGIERLNKNHQHIHSKDRASLEKSNMIKAIYVWPLKDCIRAALPEEDADQILAELAYDEEEAADTLPEWSGSDSDSEEDSDEDDAEDELLLHGPLQPPDGFTVLENPRSLLAGGDLKDLFVSMLWNTGWHTGKIKKFIPTGRRHNYNIVWNDGLRGSWLTLEKYYVVPGVGEKVAEGTW